MHYYPFNLKDYLSETAHLPPMADLAYRRLLDLYYKNEAPIPNKPKWVANRIRLDTEHRIIGFVLREYFVLEGSGESGVWRNPTCDSVIAKYQKKVAVARENGKEHKVGTKAKPKSVQNRLATKNQQPRTNKSPLPPEGEVAFHAFWTSYPRKEGRPAAIEAYSGALAAGAGPEVIMAGLKRYLGCHQWSDPTKIPHASTWLNRQGWNDTPPAAPAAAGDSGSAPWWSTRTGVVRKGEELGMTAPAADCPPSEWFVFQASVWLRCGEGEWVDRTSVSYALYLKMLNESGGSQ